MTSQVRRYNIARPFPQTSSQYQSFTLSLHLKDMADINTPMRPEHDAPHSRAMK
jgi:hypothetical protein